ncbi:LysR family transcriptional regulator [Sphingosinicella terrae]|uniref:LysR family transcriptional regulator n=1 Tax=Sphingosinicella terrae TaxID=2172047 RepID=UPI000E0D1C1A|nr:LysR family transcriptional regulator [Sphingosinicella terrae]
MRFDRLDLNLLVALDALIEDRSVSSAAKRLYLSQPALSGALNRLRDYFADDLLVQSGRQMILTPKAEELRGPVREALLFIRSRITTPLEFDPATAERKFSIVASDYAYHVLVGDVLLDAYNQAPGVTFELSSPDRLGGERLERGEIDLMITINTHLSDAHPKQPLYSDEHAVICWSEGRHKDGLTRESFIEAGHVIAVFGPERHPAFTELFFAQQGLNRRVEVSMPSFAALPPAVVGTDRLATMYRRHAEYFAKRLPITIHAPPLPMPAVVEEMQWHSLRTNDHGVQWLVGLFKARAAALPRNPVE